MKNNAEPRPNEEERSRDMSTSLFDFLRGLHSSRFYGSVELKYENGRLTIARKSVAPESDTLTSDSSLLKGDPSFSEAAVKAPEEGFDDEYEQSKEPSPTPHGNFIEKYRYYADILEVPPDAHEAVAMSIIAAVLNRNGVHVEHGAITVPLDLWLILISADDVEKYFNRRAECWGMMADWLKTGAQIPDEPEIEVDLSGVQYGYSNKSQIQLERKEDMKARGMASPDLGDCLAMSFSVKVLARPKLKQELVYSFPAAPGFGGWGSAVPIGLAAEVALYSISLVIAASSSG